MYYYTSNKQRSDNRQFIHFSMMLIYIYPVVEHLFLKVVTKFNVTSHNIFIPNHV